MMCANLTSLDRERRLILATVSLCCPREDFMLILCIDDDDGVLSFHRALLERRGYEVLTASSVRQGLQLAEVCPVAAVIVTITCPRCTGMR